MKPAPPVRRMLRGAKSPPESVPFFGDASAAMGIDSRDRRLADRRDKSILGLREGSNQDIRKLVITILNCNNQFSIIFTVG